ncbi:NAD(P)-binding protein [Karstenula rhodostoma CBS 690.94]|uniref:NAD(P)-binding protein n=1 Tax=Karstenula rhodostoma CBS 690.94 TaxID=1392251 RepID=A0A9P4P889_9PLEO|nr:NAD(P)-binding protein [Karstenula rhodostoma CBS 690.94]
MDGAHHNDTYPAIQPTNPKLGQDGKTVIITGAGSGVGRATAISFAQAGAKHVILVGRTEATLKETSEVIKNVASNTEISIFAVSVANESAVQNMAKEVGAWDVLILNAAHLSPPDTILKIPLKDFWTSYETNVKSVYIFAQSFIPLANPNATFLSVNAAGAVLPAGVGAGLTGYMSSKIAQAKLTEYIAHEHPEMFVASVHPGVIQTKLLREAEPHESKLPLDTVELSAHFMLWLSSAQDRKFLSGKMLWSNWDVDELAAKAEVFAKEGMLTMGMTGWPFAKRGLLGWTGSVR